MNCQMVFIVVLQEIIVYYNVYRDDFHVIIERHVYTTVHVDWLL